MMNWQETKQVTMDSWLLKLLSRNMKTKTTRKEDQPTKNHKKITEKKNTRKK